MNLNRPSLRTLFATAIFLSATLGSSPAWAFWFGTVPNNGIALKESASDSSRTVESLTQGTRFTAVDQPVNGYYRVRTKTNTGYIDASLIDAQNPNQHSSNLSSRPQAQAQTQTRRRPTKSNGSRWTVKVLGGVTLSNPSDVSAVLGSTSLSDPISLGFEVEYKTSPDWRLAGRFEYLSKSVTGSNATDQNTYQLSMKGYAFTVGADYILTSTPKYVISLNARAGLGKASLSSVATPPSGSTIPTGDTNETDFSGTTLTGTIAVAAEYKAFNFCWLGAEGGYRLFSTSQSAYTNGGSTVYGSTIWTSNGTPTPVSLSFSGVYGDLVARILF
ncbi:MAG: SH3 domain-containing protein [Oligoflexia bacterium]|nr:SH3 domain-containing protein [Oligoflexia bacterium]